MAARALVMMLGTMDTRRAIHASMGRATAKLKWGLSARPHHASPEVQAAFFFFVGIGSCFLTGEGSAWSFSSATIF